MRMHRSFLLAIVALASACSSETDGTAPPPTPSTDPDPTPPATAVGPVVHRTSPASGAWGTVYTIEGTDLDRGPAELTFATSFGTTGVVVERTSPAVVSWSATKIEVKVPFPADGAVELGEVDAGSFASTFAVGANGLTHGGVEPTGVLSPRPGELIVASTRKVSGTTTPEAFLYHMSSDDAEDLGLTFRRTILVRDAGGPFAILEDAAFAHSRVSLDGAGDPTPVAIADLPAAPILGSGADATGTYVWTLADKALTRYRLSGSAWTADRTVSGVYGQPRALAASEDGSLALFGTIQGGGTFDDYDNVHVQHAGPEGAALGPDVLVSGDMDDSTFSYRVWAKDSLAVSLRFCATDEKGQEFDGRACFYWSSTATPSGWGRVDFLQYDGSGASTATASCEGDALVVEDGGNKTPILYPCRNVAAFTRDPDGKPVLLVAYKTEYRLVYAKP